MTAGPLVSVVIPSFNQGQFLEAALRSALEQDYSPLEVLVIDGGSSDASLEIIRRYAPRLQYWVSEADQGQAQAINKGLRRARGDILGWLNSDDLLAPGQVRRVVEALAGSPAVDVVYGRLERIDAAGRSLPTPPLPKDRVTFGLQYVVGECVVNQAGAFWRRAAMERAGLLDESLRYALDYDFWNRMALSGARFQRLPQTAAFFRLSPGSKTVAQTEAMAVEQLAVLERLLADPRLPERLGLPAAEVRRRAGAARARIGLHAAYGAFKQRRMGAAARHGLNALRSDPSALFERRWLDLALASLRRRTSRG